MLLVEHGLDEAGVRYPSITRAVYNLLTKTRSFTREMIRYNWIGYAHLCGLMYPLIFTVYPGRRILR